MSQDTSNTLPKYFKDAAGFCYLATPSLALQPGMTPWDGAVDTKGFAAEAEPQTEPAAKPRSRSRRDPAQPEPETAE